MIALPKFASGSWRVRFQGEVEVLFFSNFIYVTYCHLACFFFYICGLFKMVFDCLWMVVELFEVLVDGCRSFLLLVTT